MRGHCWIVLDGRAYREPSSPGQASCRPSRSRGTMPASTTVVLHGVSSRFRADTQSCWTQFAHASPRCLRTRSRDEERGHPLRALRGRCKPRGASSRAARLRGRQDERHLRRAQDAMFVRYADTGPPPACCATVVPRSMWIAQLYDAAWVATEARAHAGADRAVEASRALLPPAAGVACDVGALLFPATSGSGLKRTHGRARPGRVRLSRGRRGVPPAREGRDRAAVSGADRSERSVPGLLGMETEQSGRMAGASKRQLQQPADADVLSPAVDNLVAQLTRLPGVGTRTAQRLAFHLLRVPKDEALALAAGDRRREGARPLLPRVRQPDRGGGLRDLPRRAPRPLDHLRRRAARRPDLARAHGRVPRPLPRARRLALAARRRRAGAPAHRRAARPRRAERRAGGRARDEPEHDRRGDGQLPRRPAARQGARHAPRERAARSAATSSTPTRSRSAARSSGRREMSRTTSATRAAPPAPAHRPMTDDRDDRVRSRPRGRSDDRRRPRPAPS